MSVTVAEQDNPSVIGIDPHPTQLDADSVKVNITVNASGEYLITNTHPMPPTGLVIDCLPPSKRKLAERYVHEGLHYVCELLHARIPTSVWADAIVKATVLSVNASLPAEATAKDLQDAYIALNDTIYKLSAVAQVKTNKAIAVARRHIIDKAKSDAKFILDAADKNAKALLKRAKELKAAAERERANKLIAPSWMTDNSIPIRYDKIEKRWEAGFNFSFKPKQLIYSASTNEVNETTGAITTVIKRATWNCLNATAIEVPVWQPIAEGGSYSVNAAKLGITSFLPHIHHGRACLAPADLPNRIENFDAWCRYIDSFIRCLNSGITLHDLLIGAHSWSPAAQAFVPPELLKELLRNGHSTRLFEAQFKGEVEVVDRKAEAELTWSQR